MSSKKKIVLYNHHTIIKIILIVLILKKIRFLNMKDYIFYETKPTKNRKF